MCSATHGRSTPVLALDFDGVVVDALRECAAVTYFARASSDPVEAQDLGAAMDELPEQFLARFIEIRPYCRTLADFMVANHVHHPVRSREQFDRARHAAGSGLLNHQANLGEGLRSHWRSRDAARWLDSHRVHTAIVDALQQWNGARWIVSAKDAESIRAILRHHHVLHLIDSIVGSCGSKVEALQKAATLGEVLFIDDNLDHVLAATDADRVTARWAYWGYHAPDDDDRAYTAGVEPLHQNELVLLTH